MEEITICLKGLTSGECPPELYAVLAQLNIELIGIKLGFATIVKPIDLKIEVLEYQLEKQGFCVVNGSQGQLVEKVKHLVFLMFKDDQFQKSRLNVSHYIAAQTNKSYAHISRIFSKHEGMTLERFIIEQRIDHAKQLLLGRCLTLAEIATRLGYSSVQHLSSQFHEISGMTVRMYLQSNN
jgi:AraC family transcriptional regulator